MIVDVKSSRTRNGRRALLVSAALTLGVACQRDTQPGVREQASTFDSIAQAALHDPSLRDLVAPGRSTFRRSDDTSEVVNDGWRSQQRLAARLPDRADGPTDVAVARGVRLTVTLDGAASRPVIVDEGRALYANALTDTDRVLVSDDVSLEELLVLRSPRAPHDVAWLVRAPTPPSIERDGSLVFAGSDARSRLHVPPPVAIDARGTRREASMTWDAPQSRLRVSLDTTNLVYPIVLDPRFDSLAWTPVPMIGARQGFVMAYDGARAETILFGGVNAAGNLDETWRWDGTKWRNAAPAHGPPARVDSAMVFDSVRNELVLFGGSHASLGSLNDTWRWNGTDWARADVASPPPARNTHAMGFDPVRGEVVLFGGASGVGLNDTWRWNGTTWTQASPATVPNNRRGHTITFDADNGYLVMYGGYVAVSGNPNGETWSWNGTNWTLLAASTPAASSFMHAAIWDPLQHRIFAYGGLGQNNNSRAGSRWAGTFWIGVNTPGAPYVARSRHGMVYDVARSEIVMFGGAGWIQAHLGDTWRLPNGARL